jgi:hypothetical protein
MRLIQTIPQCPNTLLPCSRFSTASRNAVGMTIRKTFPDERHFAARGANMAYFRQTRASYQTILCSLLCR